MKLRTLANAIMVVLMFGFTTGAMATATKPEKCPSAGAIQSGGLLDAEVSDGNYAAFQESNYGTNAHWAFVIGGISANSKDDALTKAKAALPSVSGAPSPIYVPDYDVWACIYGVSSGYLAVAFTPIPQYQRLQSSSTKLQLLR